MAKLLTISSQVMRGRVGGSLTSSVLETLGHEVWALPSIFLSTRPGFGTVRAHAFPPEDIDGFISALADDNALDQLDGVMTGYLPSAAHVAAAARAIKQIKVRRPDIPYLCDPVMGDDGKGLYIAEDAAEAIRDELLPIADILTPNHFELTWLTRVDALDVSAVMVTSAEVSETEITNVLVHEGKSVNWTGYRFPNLPNGTGDLFASLVLHFITSGDSAQVAFKKASARLEQIAAESAGRDVLEIASALATAGETWVCGVDGCRGGWIAVLWNGADQAYPVFCKRFEDVLALNASTIAVDMPIGLPENLGASGRAGERQVRALLGPRQSSVFAVPARAALMAEDYRHACEINLQHSDPPRKISRQCFGLFPKIREIDALMSPGLQTRVHETHPEACFWVMNNQTPVALPRKIKSRPNVDGMALRRKFLAQAGFPIDRFSSPPWPRSQVGEDDILDACAAAWSAWRIRSAKHLTFPYPSLRDAKGLRMEINV
jgi:pyridoxal/pyridoxine/pyridoxamine kinase/predicted RNase H-like nuclease